MSVRTWAILVLASLAGCTGGAPVDPAEPPDLPGPAPTGDGTGGSGGAGYAVAIVSPRDAYGGPVEVTLQAGRASATHVLTGPVPRPVMVAFDQDTSPVDAQVFGEVEAHDVWIQRDLPALEVAADQAWHRSAGAAVEGGWRLSEWGFVEHPLFVPAPGWYRIGVTGTAQHGDVPVLVHLWLNRTTVAEGDQREVVDLSTVRYLHEGIGYMLGASLENPWPDRSVVFRTLHAEPAAPQQAPEADVPVAEPGHVEGWPQFGRDAWNTRHAPSGPAPEQTRLLWRTPVDGSVTGTPAVVDGRVFAGTWNRTLYALAAADGEVLWSRSLPARLDASPAVHEGIVVVGSGDTVLAFAAADGEPLWSHSFGGGSLWASPVVDEDVYIGVVQDRGLVARLDLQTGAPIWEQAMAPPGGGARVWATPLVVPGTEYVVVGTSPGTATHQPETMDALLALHRQDGRLLWTHRFYPHDQNRQHDDNVNVEENRDISGAPQLALRGGVPVVLASQEHGPAWTVRLRDGALVHGGRLLDPRPVLLGAGGVADGVRVVSSTQPDRVAGFDLDTGDLLWQRTLPSTNFAPVAIAQGTVWIGSFAGRLHAFDLHTGATQAELPAGGGILGGVAIAYDRLYVGTLDLQGTNDFSDSLGSLPGAVTAWGTG